MPRVVPVMLGGDPTTMTTAGCARRAKERYLTVMALQYGGECFGGEQWHSCVNEPCWLLKGCDTARSGTTKQYVTATVNTPSAAVSVDAPV